MERKLLVFLLSFILFLNLNSCQYNLRNLPEEKHVYERKTCIEISKYPNIVIFYFRPFFKENAYISEKLTDEFVSYLNKNGNFNIVSLGNIKDFYLSLNANPLSALSEKDVNKICSIFGARLIIIGNILVYDPVKGEFGLDIKLLDSGTERILFEYYKYFSLNYGTTKEFNQKIQDTLKEASKLLNNYVKRLKKC